VISLRGRSTAVSLRSPLPHDVWSVTTDPGEGGPRRALLSSELANVSTARFDLVLGRPGSPLPVVPTGNTVVLPDELGHLTEGDVIAISEDGRRISVLWRSKANINSLLLTERCDNYCVMCSQPPRDVDDSYLLDRARTVIDLVPPGTDAVMLSGGEPTLYGHDLIDLVDHISTTLPGAGVHVLSNGRRFADPAYAEAWARVDCPGLMVGIPIYGAEPTLHDRVVGAVGAFDETVRGILNLCALGAAVEIRVVVHQLTAPELVAIAEFIARNLTFVDQVALMGLEMMGLARANQRDVWIDPWEYRFELSDAVRTLLAAGVPTRIYNHQLCLIEPAMWPHAVRSISDWKTEYDPACASCSVVDECGGFFASAKYKTSSHIRPVHAVGTTVVVPGAGPIRAHGDLASGWPEAGSTSTSTEVIVDLPERGVR